jgi:HEPN domain-containing protein
MPDRDVEVIRVVAGWIYKAEGDFDNATNELKRGRRAPVDTVCFHAQQMVEKYLKAMLVLKNCEVPRTHNVPALLVLLPKAARPPLTKAEQELMSDYAVITRYPGDYEPLTVADAREAVAIAKRVRTFLRRYFPILTEEASPGSTA